MQSTKGLGRPMPLGLGASTGGARFARTGGFIAAAVGLSLAAGLTAASADSGLKVGVSGIIDRGEVRSVLEVTDVRAANGRVTATLVSRSSMQIRDIQLAVRHAFLWNDERNPGTDNPGRTEYFLVLGEIEPNGSLTFEYQADPPLPQRTDGSFQTSIEIAAFTQVGAE